jgi:hypothetical protein
MATSCKTCKNCIFNETWGEHKCKVQEKRILNPRLGGIRCKDYKPGQMQTAQKKEEE